MLPIDGTSKTRGCIYKLLAIFIGLVRANEEFYAWLSGDKTMPFGENNRHVPVRLIDFDTLDNNRFVITNQYAVKALETKIPDIVLLINGIPIDSLELKQKWAMDKGQQEKLLERFNTKEDLSERLEALRDKAERGLIASIEFVKELCKIARETGEAEKDALTEQDQQGAKAALTELFLNLKNDQTPAVVERIVKDIDDIVKVVRFDGW